MSYGTRPFRIPQREDLARSWVAWFAVAVAAAIVLCALTVLAAKFLRWVEYQQTRSDLADIGALYCADVPDGVDQLTMCRDYACLEAKATALDANSEALIKHAIRCERVLDAGRE